MSTLKLASYAAAITPLTTQLNALASGARSVASSAIDNTSDLNLYVDIDLSVTFGSSPTAGRAVTAYLVPSVDGTNYADGSDTVAPAASLAVASFVVRAVNTAQRLVKRGVMLTPGKWKWIILNDTDQAFSASGHVFTSRAYNLQAA
jgi:hypothetical protein